MWAKHQNKNIIVIKPIIDNRYNQEKIITHNDLSHDCFSMKDWTHVNGNFKFTKDKVDVVFLDEVQFMNTKETIENVERILDNGIDVMCSGLDQDSREDLGKHHQCFLDCLIKL